MKNAFIIFALTLIMAVLPSCEASDVMDKPSALHETRSISYEGVEVTVVIDKPAIEEVDVLVLFHGTVVYDVNLIQAANNILGRFRELTDRDDVMLVSVAYPGEHKLLGDNITEAEAALLWVKHVAGTDLNVTIRKIFLAGHSQGGYLVTRLNTMHATDGVIANAPGPLNLVYRCYLEESGRIEAGAACNKLNAAYGTTAENPEAYRARSLRRFTSGYQSDILFVQGLDDSPIHMSSWPTFKQLVTACTDCAGREFLEIDGGSHGALFDSPVAGAAFNEFINR
ncbi:MAG: Alpha/beta hydrolase family [Bacteroidetes bacterium HLUCCA01]|nr:MAG: Alpha/beta hydrolase family [Bacteroidetes bacterium HLUCCA01]